MSIKDNPPHHIPVLLDKVIKTMNPKRGESYLDLTAGYGGHASKILNITGNYLESILVDRDEYAVKNLAFLKEKGATILNTDFYSACCELIDKKTKFDLILIDLGVSSPQLDQPERGFSFTKSGPLDMRMDRRQELSADYIVNHYKEQDLLEIITKYGEEKLGFAKRIVKAIIKNRPIKDTKELADVILKEHVGKWSKTHPATRTFQALRIEVNQELAQIEMTLPLLKELLNSGGRLGIISFHSLEDRLVKKYFKSEFDAGLEADLIPVNKKVIDGATEDVYHPRSRSAKLRVAMKK